MISLTLTYLMQVYSALRERNALGLAIDTLTAETGDAAKLLAGVAAGGDFSSASSQLGELASQMIEVKERTISIRSCSTSALRIQILGLPLRARCARCRVSFTQRARWAAAQRLETSGPVEQLYRASLMLVRTLEKTFLRGAPPDPSVALGRNTAWRRRCSDAIAYLADAGLPTKKDTASAQAAYVTLRSQWDGEITKLAPALGYELAAIDIAGAGGSSAAPPLRSHAWSIP